MRLTRTTELMAQERRRRVTTNRRTPNINFIRTSACTGLSQRARNRFTRNLFFFELTATGSNGLTALFSGGLKRHFNRIRTFLMSRSQSRNRRQALKVFRTGRFARIDDICHFTFPITNQGQARRINVNNHIPTLISTIKGPTRRTLLNLNNRRAIRATARIQHNSFLDMHNTSHNSITQVNRTNLRRQRLTMRLRTFLLRHIRQSTRLQTQARTNRTLVNRIVSNRRHQNTLPAPIRMNENRTH